MKNKKFTKKTKLYNSFKNKNKYRKESTFSGVSCEYEKKN